MTFFWRRFKGWGFDPQPLIFLDWQTQRGSTPTIPASPPPSPPAPNLGFGFPTPPLPCVSPPENFITRQIDVFNMGAGGLHCPPAARKSFYLPGAKAPPWTQTPVAVIDPFPGFGEALHPLCMNKYITCGSVWVCESFSNLSLGYAGPPSMLLNWEHCFWKLQFACLRLSFLWLSLSDCLQLFFLIVSSRLWLSLSRVPLPLCLFSADFYLTISFCLLSDRPWPSSCLLTLDSLARDMRFSFCE